MIAKARKGLAYCLKQRIGEQMRKKFQPPNRSLIDLRDERDDLRVRLSLLEDNRLSSTADLFLLKQDLATLERRIAIEGA